MIWKYPNVFRDTGKLEGTVKIDLWDGTIPYQAGACWIEYVLQKPLHG